MSTEAPMAPEASKAGATKSESENSEVGAPDLELASSGALGETAAETSDPSSGPFDLGSKEIAAREASSRAAMGPYPSGGEVPSHGDIPLRGDSGRSPTFGVELDELPNRYEIRDQDGGRQMVRCREAPGIAVSIDRSYSFTEPEARKLGPRSILVDGAGAFGPLVDDSAHLYNLDHHEGCFRAFTLATCEQALILVHKGLELDRGDWTVYANEPDLDTILAIWILLNYRRVRELDTEARDRIVPLIRLEGAIDANGFEAAELCGLPQARLAEEKIRLDRLVAREMDMKRSGVWSKGDQVSYSRDMLLAIDSLVYSPGDFDDYTSVEEEYGHVDIGQGKVAVVCRDGGGIYDVEKRLKKVWSDRLGLIALEKDAGHYTLRRTASLAGIELAEAYDRLNLLDPAVDGRPPGKRWGGSDDIGGSPRPTGTGLTPREIGKILKLTYKKLQPAQRLRNLGAAAAWPIAMTGAAWLVVFAMRFFGWSSATPRGELLETLAAGSFVMVAAIIVIRRVSRGWLWLYGWRRPSGRDWLGLPVLGLVAGVAGGAWVPAALPTSPEHLALGLAALTAVAISLALIFHSLIHGLLILDYRVQTVGGSWFLSKANLASALLFALITTGFSSIWLLSPYWPVPFLPSWALVALVSFVTGLILGVMRERSLSVWPGLLTLLLAAICRLGLSLWGG